MVIARWKFDGVFNADPNKVAEEIYSIGPNGEGITPQQILEKGRDENSELHKCFEWDDSVAAEKYRIEQARDIVRFLVIQRPEKKEQGSDIRVFYAVENGRGYVPTEVIIRNPEEHEKMLARARSEFEAFRIKYKTLEEFREIFDLFDKIA